MPSALPRFVIRAPQENIDAWKAAAGGSANQWALDALDQAAGRPGSSRPARATRRLADECPRNRHHRLGVFCKECGAVG